MQLKYYLHVCVWTFECMKRVAKSEETDCKILNLMQSTTCQILTGIHLQLSISNWSFKACICLSVFQQTLCTTTFFLILSLICAFYL